MNETPRWMTLLRSGLTVIFLVYAGVQVYGAATGAKGDPMFFSGSATCLLGIWLCGPVRGRSHAVIDRLRRNGVLRITELQLGTVHKMEQQAAARAALWGALTTGAAELLVVLTGTILVPWMLLGKSPIDFNGGIPDIGASDATTFAGLLVICLIAGSGGGWYLGLLAGYGRMPAFVAAAGGRLRAQVDASDGMGGLRPLLEFSWQMSALVLLPAAWIGAWLVLTAFTRFGQQYGNWRAPLFLLFLLSLYYAVVGFLRPAMDLQLLFREQQQAGLDDPELGGSLAAAARRAAMLVGLFWVIAGGLGATLVAVNIATAIGDPRGLIVAIVLGPLASSAAP
jgi:hypothetical protein